MKLRDEILNVAESPMVQIATIAESMPGSLKLCYGESDMPTPAIHLPGGRRGDAGRPHLLHAYRRLPRIARGDRAQDLELHQVRYDVPEIMATVGGTMAIYAAIRALVGRGDNAVIVSPAYAIFSNAVIMSGGEPRPASLARQRRSIRPRSRSHPRGDRRATRVLIVVNSPSNPTGWVITEDEQRALAEIAERHDVVILADEVYERLVYDGAPIAPSFARVVTNRDRLIVINSFSKTYNMTGLASGLGADQRAHDQGDVQGRRVHDVESRGDGAAGRHRRPPRRRAVHRGAARALSAAARSGQGRARRIFPAFHCRIRRAPSTRSRNSTTAPIAPHLRLRLLRDTGSRSRPASVLAAMAKATSAYALHPPKPPSPSPRAAKKYVMSRRS